ncbi:MULTISPECIES: hypothetical protein [Bradyrhizobium]|uniref:hypothetical protein n=1 Tax=Bradyrhizobium TaxID=374 RepID=UPI00041B80DB|nr:MULTISPECIES: hypothetical protein [Bradyrhizobium]UFW46284.1 hypothetical protein BaraCB756_28695 [Bradyrhizobium arachidis]
MVKIDGGDVAGLTPRQLNRIVKAIEEDLELLEDFNRRVDHLERSGFSKRYEADIPNVITRLENVSFECTDGPRVSFVAQVHSWIEDFSQDEIDAFILSYRIFSQRNDRLSIASLAGIYDKEWMPPSARACFEDARKQLNDHLDGPATVTFPDGFMLERTLVNVIIYGGLAHSNKQKAKIFESWENSGVMGFMWADFMAYAKEAVETLKYMRGLNRAVIEALNTEGLRIEAVASSST